MRKNILLLVFVVSLCAAGARGQAANVYLTQDGSSQPGCTLTPRYSAAQFDNAANWGTGGTQIGIGTTVHWCGTISSELDIRGSGISAGRITIFCETGCKWMNATIPGDQAIYSGGNSWIVLDGGVPCGRPTDVCNGQIGNSANGTALTNHVSQTAITLSGATDWEIKNWNLGPLYIRTSTTDPFNPDDGSHGITYAHGFARIYIHDSQIHDAPWALNFEGGSGDLGLKVKHNYFYHVSHGGAIFNSDGAAVSDIEWSYNVLDGAVNWDGTDSAHCPYHHDGLHVASTSAGTVSTIYHHDNWYRGDWGVCNTSALYIENNEGLFGNVLNTWFWNDVYQNTNTTSQGWSDGINNLPHSGAHMYNETIICSPGGGVGLTTGGLNTDTQNVVVTGCSVMNNTSNQNTTFTALNNNLYANFVSNGNQPFKLNGVAQGGSGLAGSFATWAASTGKESGSQTAASAGLDSLGAPQTGSIILTMPGANLTSLCTGNLVSLCTDTALGGTRTPVARPATGNWMPGAYQSGGAPPPPPTQTGPPPVLLGVTVSHLFDCTAAIPSICSDWQEAR